MDIRLRNHHMFFLSVIIALFFVVLYIFNRFLYLFKIHIHTFLASEALKNMKVSKKSQSIMITGVSGSGKTENGKHIVDFLCETKSNSQSVIDAGLIFEEFGNARTRANDNSSRFCKLLDVCYFYSFYSFLSIHFISLYLILIEARV